VKLRIQLAALSVLSLLIAPGDTAFSAQDSWAAGPLLYEDTFEGASLQNWIPELEKPDVSVVEIRESRLNIDVGGGATIWFKHRLEGYILIEYDVMVIENGGPNDRVSDLNQFWMASDPANTNLFTRTGTFTQYGNLRLYYVGTVSAFNHPRSRVQDHQELQHQGRHFVRQCFVLLDSFLISDPGVIDVPVAKDSLVDRIGADCGAGADSFVRLDTCNRTLFSPAQPWRRDNAYSKTSTCCA